MNFAAIEAATASAAAALFCNLHLTVGAYALDATLSRGVEQIGEYDLTSERRDSIAVLKTAATAAGFASGVAISADSSRYSVAELAAMERTSWKLDRVASDDGHIVTWWLK